MAQTIAAALGAKEKKDGCIEGSGYLISWCVGHLVQLAEVAAYGEQYKKWSYDSLPILPLSTNIAAQKLCHGAKVFSKEAGMKYPQMPKLRRCSRKTERNMPGQKILFDV